MSTSKLWTMKITPDDKKTIRRTATRLQLTQAGLVKMLIRIADELTQEKQTDKEKHPTAA